MAKATSGAGNKPEEQNENLQGQQGNGGDNGGDGENGGAGDGVNDNEPGANGNAKPVVAAVVTSPAEKKVTVVAFVDHTCRIGDEEIVLVKDKPCQVSQMAAAVLSHGRIAYKK